MGRKRAVRVRTKASHRRLQREALAADLESFRANGNVLNLWSAFDRSRYLGLAPPDALFDYLEPLSAAILELAGSRPSDRQIGMSVSKALGLTTTRGVPNLFARTLTDRHEALVVLQVYKAFTINRFKLRYRIPSLDTELKWTAIYRHVADLHSCEGCPPSRKRINHKAVERIWGRRKRDVLPPNRLAEVMR